MVASNSSSHWSVVQSFKVLIQFLCRLTFFALLDFHHEREVIRIEQTKSLLHLSRDIAHKQVEQEWEPDGHLRDPRVDLHPVRSLTIGHHEQRSA